MIIMVINRDKNENICGIFGGESVFGRDNRVDMCLGGNLVSNILFLRIII